MEAPSATSAPVTPVPGDTARARTSAGRRPPPATPQAERGISGNPAGALLFPRPAPAGPGRAASDRAPRTRRIPGHERGRGGAGAGRRAGGLPTALRPPRGGHGGAARPAGRARRGLGGRGGGGVRARALGAPGARAPRDPVHDPRVAARARPSAAAPPAPGERRSGPAGLEAGEGPGGSAERGRARRAVPRGGDDGGLVWAAGRGGDGGQWAAAAQGLPGQSARLRGLRSAVAPSLELGACLQTLPRRPAGAPVVLSLGAMGRRDARPWILQPGPWGAKLPPGWSAGAAASP